jgi:PAS domain S-box-containing protein
MSKQFDSKKETLSIINKAYGDNSNKTSQDLDFKSLKEKFDVLAKRTKSLEQVYQFHKGIIQSISSGLITIDFEGNITFINNAALQLLDFDYKDLVGESIKKIFADENEANSILNELINKKHMFESREANLISKDLKILPIGFTTTLLKASDISHIGVIFSFRDLTNLHHFRVQMERFDRLATLGEVSAGIAHEIRNPLAGIKTSAQVLEESFSPGDERSQLIRRIVKEIDRSNDLLKKFFNFAQPGKPKQDFVSLDALVEGVFLLLAPRMRKKNISFNKHYDSDIAEVYVDENQVEQILINLFLNAIDAMGKGGTLTVSLKTENSNIADNDISTAQMVVLEMEDTGQGIDEENLEKIFNPFFTTKSEGVGLGLSISSRLVEENGGQINVESHPGEGTRFTVKLPTT